MRISFILSSLWLSGGVRIIAEYATRLAQRGHTISLIIPGGTRDPDVADDLLSSVTIRESQVHRQLPGGMLNNIQLSYSLAQAVPPSDIIISTHTPTTLAGLLATRVFKRGKPVWFYEDYREMFTGRLVESWLARYALRWHELALVLSEYSIQELNEYSSGKVIVVGSGLIPAGIFKPLPAERYAQGKNGWTRTILFLGDMRPRKGLFDFLQATEVLHKQLEDIKLLIVSKENCQINSPIPFEYIYRPTRPALAKLYATCDLFVSASWWESFGLPPLEAMACGAPVVLTDSRGVREFAQPEKNCLMVPPQNPPALARAMYRVLTDADLANRLRTNGPKTAKRFDWDSAVDRFEMALRSVMD